MAIENYSLYNETDPNAHIEKTASVITVAGMTRAEDARVWDDKGVGHFGDFEHDFECRMTDGLSYGRGLVWGVSNTVDDLHYWETYGIAAVYVEFDWDNLRLHLMESQRGNVDSYNLAGSNIPYWCRITRIGLDISCKIYSDDHVSLLSTLNIELDEVDLSYRYIFGVNSRNTPGLPGYSIDYTSSNLDLREDIVDEDDLSFIGYLH